MTPLRQRMREDMQLRGLSPKTQACYLFAIQQFAQLYGAKSLSAAFNRVAARRIRGQDGREGIAHGLEDAAPMPRNRLPEDAIMPGTCHLHGSAMLLPAGGRALDIGEEEGDGARWQVGHRCCPPA